MTDTLKPCPIDEGHHSYLVMSNRSDPNRMWVQCMDCNTYTPYAVWQSLPRRGDATWKSVAWKPRTAEQLIEETMLRRTLQSDFSPTRFIVQAARNDIATMLREKARGYEQRAYGALYEIADEIERMP